MSSCYLITCLEQDAQWLERTAQHATTDSLLAGARLTHATQVITRHVAARSPASPKSIGQRGRLEGESQKANARVQSCSVAVPSYSSGRVASVNKCPTPG
jgi:hypothetical protein